MPKKLIVYVLDVLEVERRADKLSVRQTIWYFDSS